MKIFLFRISRIVSVTIMSSIIFLVSFLFYNQSQIRESNLELRKLDVGPLWLSNDEISNDQIFLILFLYIVLLIILLTFNWLVLSQCSVWVNRKKYLDNIENVKKIIFRFSRVLSVVCIFFLIVFFVRVVNLYIDENKIIFDKIFLLFISFTILIFNYLFFGKLSIWIKKSEDNDKEII